VDISPYANIPPTETCITCHHEIKTANTEVQKLLVSHNTGDPIEWIRVHDLPDHVYFNHSIHVQKGIGCTECHGQVDTMEVVWRAEDLTMGWCLDCHRNPEDNIRPREEVYNMQWETDNLSLEERVALVEEYNIDVGELDHCNICHR
jgi:hypothetical protein